MNWGEGRGRHRPGGDRAGPRRARSRPSGPTPPRRIRAAAGSARRAGAGRPISAKISSGERGRVGCASSKRRRRGRARNPGVAVDEDMRAGAGFVHLAPEFKQAARHRPGSGSTAPCVGRDDVVNLRRLAPVRGKSADGLGVGPGGVEGSTARGSPRPRNGWPNSGMPQMVMRMIGFTPVAPGLHPRRANTEPGENRPR